MTKMLHGFPTTGFMFSITQGDSNLCDLTNWQFCLTIGHTKILVINKLQKVKFFLLKFILLHRLISLLEQTSLSNNINFFSIVPYRFAPTVKRA